MAALVTAASSAVLSAVGGWAYTGAQAIGFSAATASTISIYAGTVAALGTAAAITVGLPMLARPSVPDPETGKQSRRQPRPERLVFMGGGSRGGGAYMLRETSGSTLALVLAISDGRLASISSVYLNDDLVTLDGSGWVQEGDDGRYGSGDLVQIKTRLGIPTETHYSELTPKFAAIWPTTARGDGIGSLMMLATHKSKESFPKHFPNGEPVPTVVAQGVCYDWRADSTAGGSGSQRRDDPSTWQASANPVVWLVHHEWYRCGRSWDRCIEPVLADLTDEADYCDESVAKVGGTEPRYAFGGNYFASTQPQARREAILAACDGWLSTNGQGHLVIKVGRYVAPTFTLTGDHITGYEWAAFSPDEEHINKLAISYTDPAKDYTETECDPWVDEDDITATGLERSEPLALTWVQSRSQARRLAKRKMSRLLCERRGQIVTGVYGLNAFGHRYIRVQNAELTSMADVVVEVMGVEFDPMSCTVVLDVILADTDIDAWNPATEEGSAVSDAERPPPEALTTPTIDTVMAFYEETGSGSGVRLSIDGDGPDREDLTWFARWRVNGATSWVEAQFTDAAPGSPVLLTTGFVTAEETLDVQIAYQTGGGTLSGWSATETVVTSTPIAALAFPAGPFRVGVASANQVDALEGWTYARAGAATGQNADGTVVTFAGDGERITDQGLLIEAAATNPLLRSQEFDDAVWDKGTGGSITANTIVAPDGTTTADAYTWPSGTATFAFLSQAVSGDASAAIVFSVWMKLPSGSKSVRLDISDVSLATTGSASFTLTTAWQRVAFVLPAATLSNTGSIGVGLASGSSGTPLAAGDVVHIWGAQIDTGSAPTSYIPTAGASATRAADTATLVLPAGSSSDLIAVVHSGGTVNTTRGALANPLLLDLGGASGGGWVSKYIETVTVSPA